MAASAEFCQLFQKWRQRWFVLRQSGNLPGQYLLEYYTPNRRRLRGCIDLDQCEKVDTGVTYEPRKSRHPRYTFMFDIRTASRVYYLVAQTAKEMDDWVSCICQVCGLKINSAQDYARPSSRSLSPASSVSSFHSMPPKKSLYIPISECHSSRINFYENSESLRAELDLDAAVPPSVNWDTYPGYASDTSAGYDTLPSRPPAIVTQFEHTNLNDSGFDTQRSSSPQDDPQTSHRDEDRRPSLTPPPRPPKPTCFRPKKTSYENIELSSPVKPPKFVDEGPQYDFPRNLLSSTVPLPRCRKNSAHIYSNTGAQDEGYLAMEGTRPLEDYTDMSAAEPPPRVNRDLKPRRHRNILNGHSPPPPLIRVTRKSFQDSWDEISSPPPVPTRGHRRRPPPLNLPPSDHTVPPACSGGRKDEEIKYLDLALETEGGGPAAPRPLTTVYKTVDFIKTKAFNEERQSREATYKKSSQ